MGEQGLEFKLVVSPQGDANYNLAVDDALMNFVRENQRKEIFIRFHRYKSAAIIAAYRQHLSDFNLSTMRNLGISLARRKTTGGAMYCSGRESSELHFSIIGCAVNGILGNSVQVHEYFGNRTVSCLKEKELGIDARLGQMFFVKIGDLPIVGTAQHWTAPGCEFLYQGTIPVQKFDAELLAKVINLRPGEKEIIEKLPHLSAYTKWSSDYLKARFIGAWIDSHKTKIIELGDLDMGDKIAEAKSMYENEDWKFKSSIENDPALASDRGFCFCGPFYQKPKTAPKSATS